MTIETHKSVLSILLLVTDLAPCGNAVSVRHLCSLLPRDRFRVAVGVIGERSEQHFQELRSSGVVVLSLPIRHLFDVTGMRRLSQIVREIAPDIVHAWNSSTLGVARLIVSHCKDGSNWPRLVVSGAAHSGGGILAWLNGQQLRRADRVVPTTRIDGERYRRLGVSSDRLSLIGPAAPACAQQPDRAGLWEQLKIPSSAQLLLNGGRTERGTGLKDAIVAFDMLRYDNPNLQLIIFGAGRDAFALEHFGRALAFDDFRIHFARCVPDRTHAVQFAYAVMITQTQGGIEEALEAMAAGKPVVGWATPELAEIVDDGETGFLVPIGDRAALATKTRKLLDEPTLAERLGDAGRKRAAERFSAGRMIDQFARLYAELAGHNG